VHRDMRPENIPFESDHALVGDFGNAGVLESAGGERLSASGIVLSAPSYCSPEQAGGKCNLDGRAEHPEEWDRGGLRESLMLQYLVTVDALTNADATPTIEKKVGT
jgi:hypothetical protein